MQKVESGNISLDTKVQIKDEDRTSSYGELYRSAENEVTIRKLLERMLVDSDNTALRILLRQIDFKDLQFVLDYYGLDIKVVNLTGSKHVDLISAKSIGNILSSLYFSTVLEPENSEYLLALLSQASFDVRNFSGIPKETRIAHKFGENYYKENKFFHDCGIIYAESKRILYCIMTKGMDEKKSKEAVGYSLGSTYRYVIETGDRLEKYKG